MEEYPCCECIYLNYSEEDNGTTICYINNPIGETPCVDWWEG